ncbi:MAG: outer membrane beta-barrel protein [Bacteroidota bacterium]
MIKIGAFFFCLLSSVFLTAQVLNTAYIDSVGGEKVGKLSISGWMDTYYAQSNYSDWNQPTITPVIPGLVSNSYYGLVDINLAYVDFRYATDRLKIRLVPAFGSYMDKNYSGTNTLNNLMEGQLCNKL